MSFKKYFLSTVLAVIFINGAELFVKFLKAFRELFLYKHFEFKQVVQEKMSLKGYFFSSALIAFLVQCSKTCCAILE